jgi:hypothetical protein
MGNSAATPAVRLDSTRGTRDGDGAGDHDAPYLFGRRPTASAPYPFTTRQYVRLLILRSRIQTDGVGDDDREDAHPIAFLPDGVWVASASDLLVSSS